MKPILILTFLLHLSYSYTYTDYNISALKRGSDDPYNATVVDKNTQFVFNVYDIVTSFDVLDFTFADYNCTAASVVAFFTRCMGFNDTEETTFADDGQSFVAKCFLSIP